MSPTVFPYILMVALVISHTIAIQFLHKKRQSLDIATPEGASKAKQLRFIMTMLYIEIPIITAFIWLVLAPMMVPVDN